ncbi:MAG: helix-turn-helix domain-containing protein [Bacteroidales bacterium]|nr:helix-turn-helix domain-containing protein [Bacteroidales bacterium]
MNALLPVLAVFSAAEAVAVMYLYLRLRRKEAELQAVAIQSAQEDSKESAPSPEEVTATDQFLYDRCCRFMMERRPFLVSSFTLDDLANAMFTNRLYLSKVINRFSGKNFRKYVNYYRVMYAMDLFQENMSLRIQDMTQLSGFHSETSFYQSFVGVMGEAPSHWCARMKRKARENLSKK